MNSIVNTSLNEAYSIIEIFKSFQNTSTDNDKIGFNDHNNVFHKVTRSTNESWLGDDTIPLFKGFDCLQDKILTFHANLPETMCISDAEELLNLIKKIKQFLPILNRIDLSPYSKYDKLKVEEKVNSICQTYFQSLMAIEQKLKNNSPPTDLPPGLPKDYSDTQSDYSSLSDGSTDKYEDNGYFTAFEEISENQMTNIESNNLGFEAKTGINDVAFHLVQTLQSLEGSILSNKINYDEPQEIFLSGSLNNNLYYYTGAKADSLIKGIDSVTHRLMILNSLKKQELSILGLDVLQNQLMKIESLIPTLYDIKLDYYSKSDQEIIEEKIEFLIEVFLKTKTGIHNEFETKLPPIDLPPILEEQECEIQIVSIPFQMRKFIQKREDALAELRCKILSNVFNEWEMDTYFKK
ncbi:MAG: hypothetical protein H0V82_02195 [Candidatus Protochlamydia sp.]|nr:hypothetical protein [Candidatus Protochlamydia sp.]